MYVEGVVDVDDKKPPPNRARQVLICCGLKQLIFLCQVAGKWSFNSYENLSGSYTANGIFTLVMTSKNTFNGSGSESQTWSPTQKSSYTFNITNGKISDNGFDVEWICTSKELKGSWKVIGTLTGDGKKVVGREKSLTLGNIIDVPQRVYSRV